jgi:hypothetical protein
MGIEVLRDSDAAWTALYFGLLEVLEADETLRAVGVTWSVMDGDRYSGDPASDSELPWVRLWPPSLPTDELAINEYEVVCSVRVEVVTATLDYRVHGNLWGALFNALIREKDFRGQPLDRHFADLGSYNYTLRGDQPASPWPAGSPSTPGGNNLRSSGALVFRLITDA